MHKFSRKTMLVVLALVGPIPASGWANVQADGRRMPPEPPQQAFDACLGKSEGASVEITTPQGGTMKAVCRSFGSRLAAVPEGAAPPPGGDGPHPGDGGSPKDGLLNPEGPGKDWSR